MKELKYLHEREKGKGIWRLPVDNQRQESSREGIIEKYQPSTKNTLKCMYETELIVSLLSATKEMWSCIFNSTLQPLYTSGEVKVPLLNVAWHYGYFFLKNKLYLNGRKRKLMIK